MSSMWNDTGIKKRMSPHRIRHSSITGALDNLGETSEKSRSARHLTQEGYRYRRGEGIVTLGLLMTIKRCPWGRYAKRVSYCDK